MTVDGKVQLSIVLRTFAAQDPGSWAHVIRQAETLDRAGVDRLAVSDHVVFGEDLDAYGRPEIGGQAGGTQPTGPDGHWLEPITLLSLLAGRTSRIRLATNVLIAALRRPVVLAKTAATLDVLSGGRLDLGVGVGWQREEYQAAGVPIWVSGSVNPPVARRLARYGARWIPWLGPAADLGVEVARMRDALDRAGGEPARLQVVGLLPTLSNDGGGLDIAGTIAGVPALVASGATDVRLTLRAPDDPVRHFDQVSAVVAEFRAVAG